MSVNPTYFAILHSLAKEFNNVRGFYILFCSFADNLNLIQEFQLARDLGEEVLITSFHDKCPEYGWFVLFSIYMGQFNIVDSLLYGVILFSVIFKNTPISKPFFKNIIQSTFNFYRNFSLSGRAERIYHSYRNTMELEPYEGQKLDLSYFYLLLQNLDVDLRTKLRQYLDKEMPLIQGFGIDSARPWFSFLCQVEAKQGLDPVLKTYEEAFEQEVPKGFIELIRAKAVINLSANKEEVIRGLVRLKKTRNREDYISEIFHVTMPARSLMAASVKENDIEGFLISSIVKADSSTYFVNQTVADGSILPIIYQEDEELKSKLLNYPQYLCENLVILPHQVCLWLFESENRLWSLVYDGQEFIGIKNHGHWSKERMGRWVCTAPHGLDRRVRVADRIPGPGKGQKGSCHEKTEIIQSRIQTPSH